MTGTDNLGSNFDIQRLQEQTVEFTEVSTSELAEAQRMKSSISTSEDRIEDILQHLMPDSPKIDQPDQNLINESQKEVVQYNSENLSSDDVNTVLKNNPEFESLLKQSGLNEQDVTNYVRNNLLEHNPTSENISQLTTNALIERMELASTMQPNNTELQQSVNSLKVEQYTQNHPETKMLKDVLTNQFVQQGHSPEKAAAMANEQIVANLSGVKGSKAITEAINTSLTNQVGNPEFVGAATTAINLFQEAGKSAQAATAKAGTEGTQQTGKSELVAQGEELQNTLDAELEHVQTMMNTISSLNLPGEISLPLLKFLASIAEALQELKQLQSQFAVQEGEKGMKEALAKIEQADMQYQNVMKKIEEALKKLEEMENMKNKMGPLKTFMDVANIMTLVLAAVAAVVIFVVLSVVLGPIGSLLALAIIPLIIGPAIAMFTINQTGDMQVASQFFAEASNKMMEMMGVDNPAGWEGPLVIMGAIAAIAVIVTLIAIPLVPFLIVAAITLLVLAIVAIVALITSVVFAVIAIVIAIVIFVVMALIAMIVVAAILAMAMLAAQLFIAMLMESGILEIVAKELGGALGMDEDEQLVFQGVLKGMTMFGASLAGQQTPEHTAEADYAENRQREFDEDAEVFHGKERYEREYKMAEEDRQRLNPYLNIQPMVDLVALSLRNDAERTEEEIAEELESVREIFNDMIKMLEKLLANLLAGGESGEFGSKESLKEAFTELAGFTDGTIKEFIPDNEGTPEIDIEALWPMIETLQQGFPGNLSEEDINNFSKFQEQAGTGDLNMESLTKG